MLNLHYHIVISKMLFGERGQHSILHSRMFPWFKVNDEFSCSDTGKTTMPQAISFGKQMVEGGSSFHERVSSDVKYHFRTIKQLEIPAIPKVWTANPGTEQKEQSDSV